MRRFQLAAMAIALAGLILAGCEKEGKQPAPPEEQESQKEKTFTANGVSFTMVQILAGTAKLGCNNKEIYNWDDNPAHDVELSSYCIGQTEVAQELYKTVMGSNPSKFTESNKLPVEKVTWYDAVAFCNELTKIVYGSADECVYYSDEAMENAYTKDDAVARNAPYPDWDKKGFRLPTEAEWEWAARGCVKNESAKYAGTNDEAQLGDYAWYDANSSGKTHEVGTRKANEYGPWPI